jgi:hypothetical protein
MDPDEWEARERSRRESDPAASAEMNRRIRAAVGIDVEENDPSVDDEDDEEQPAPLAAGFEGGAQGRGAPRASRLRSGSTSLRR